MNRAEKRQYIKDHRKDEMASYCEVCKGKTLHYTRPTGKDLCDIVCECCGKAAIQNEKGIVPMVYVRLDAMKEVRRKLEDDLLKAEKDTPIKRVSEADKDVFALGKWECEENA